MNKFLVFIMLFACFKSLDGQNLTFLYDNSGNCYRKYLTVVMSSPARQNSENSEETQPQTDQIGDLKVTVFPNPTEGVLKVAVIGASGENLRFTLLDAGGKILQNFTSQTLDNEVDMTSYATGIYILRLVADRKQSVFQIIKK
ncbi:MAG: T9SS type A sorting domain-containing protein [Prevotellaceae bacterium]|nr:T9SS type A sorting domain-containing protein [Prevotellaceae bacterium]